MMPRRLPAVKRDLWLKWSGALDIRAGCTYALMVMYHVAHQLGVAVGMESMASQPLSEQVYEHVVAALHRKELQPGDPLDRRSLAAQLGVSVSPVLEAMTRLQHEGFLEVVARRGTRIRTVLDDDFRGTLLVRNALECQAARLYCGGPVREAADSLRALAREVDLTRDGPRINWPAEIRLHRALVALTDCRAFLEEYDRVMRVGLFVLVNTFSMRDPFPPDPSGRWHLTMVEQLREASPDEAEAIMRDHLESGREAFLAPAGRLVAAP